MRSGHAARALVIATLGWGCKGEAPGQSHAPAVTPAPPTVTTGAAVATGAAVPATAAAFAKTFATEVVGDITPVVPVAGDYAMAMTLQFETFVTTELEISDDRTGALRLTLAPDRTARACAGVIRHHVSAGQYHYEPDPAKRQHSETKGSHLNALAGTWQVVDGVAVIKLDRTATATCDPSQATATGAPITELHCIGVTGTDRVPAGSLLCETTASSTPLELGMPLTEASRKTPDGRRGANTAYGPDLVLGAPGVVIEVRQTARMQLPDITFRAGAAPLVETDYVVPRP